MIVLGIGSGRSGTTSLARLLDGCEDTCVTHEDAPIRSWGGCRENAMEWLRRPWDAPAVWGDVAYKWLPYVKEALQTHSDLRVVSIRRDADEVARSFVRHVNERSQLTCFPGYVQHERSESAFLRYAKNYQARVDRLAIRHERVSVVHVNALNTRAGQRAIFEAAGISKERRRYQEECHYNTG